MDQLVSPNWSLRNKIYKYGIVLYFFLSVYLARNRFLFGTWMPLTRADLVPLVNQRLAPVVRAIKEYQDIHGVLPADKRDLTPWFPARDKNGINRALWGDSIWNGQLHYRYDFGEITYSFPPRHEGWEIHGTVLNGTIPAPVVPTRP